MTYVAQPIKSPLADSGAPRQPAIIAAGCMPRRGGNIALKRKRGRIAAWAAMFSSFLVAVPILALGVHLDDLPTGFRIRLLVAAAISPKGSTAVIGDSIVQQACLANLCGRTFNAGVGGSNAGEAARLVPVLLPALKPDRVIVAIGINDAREDRPRSVALFRRDYRTLLDKIGSRLYAVVEVNPVEMRGFGKLYDSGFIQKENAVIREEAARRHVRIVPAAPTAQGMTHDGVHLNEAGERAWRRRLAAVCQPLTA